MIHNHNYYYAIYMYSFCIYLSITYVYYKTFITGTTWSSDEEWKEDEEMIEILDVLHKYVPLRKGELKAVFLGGDQLACERIQGAQMARLQSPDPTQRLEGLIAKIEDWHSLQAFYQVMKNVHI